MRSMVWGLGACSLLGIGCASFGEEVEATHAAEGPGPEMAAAYDAVFNDLALLMERGPGVLSRVPNNPLDAHKGLTPESRFASESKLNKLRARLLADGYTIEEGVFTLLKPLWRPVQVEPKARPPLAKEPNAPIDAPRRVSRVAMWRLNIESNGGAKLFGRAHRSFGKVNEGLLDFADEATDRIAKDPKATIDRKVGDWSLYAQAIIVRKQECLRCHSGMKVGEPIAVSAFAIKKNEPKSEP